MVFGSLGPAGELQERSLALGCEAFALGIARRAAYPAAIARLAAWLRREHVRIVQTHLFDGSVVGLAAARLAGVPLRILTTHHVNDAFLHYALRGKRRSFLVDRFSSRHLANRVIAVSSHVRKTLERHHGLRHDRIAQIGMGYDFDGWTASAEARARLRGEWGADPGGAVVFGSIGRINWIKDHESLLRAFALVRREGTAAKLVVAGPGDTTALRDLSGTLGISHDVVFAGFYPRLQDILSAIDVLVNSSLTEASNQAIAEALAMSRFVVATAVGAASEQIVDGETGLLTPPGDTGQLAVAMTRAARQWRGALNSTGAETARAMSAERMVRAYERQYETWLRELGAPGRNGVASIPA